MGEGAVLYCTMEFWNEKLYFVIKPVRIATFPPTFNPPHAGSVLDGKSNKLLAFEHILPVTICNVQGAIHTCTQEVTILTS